MNVNIPLYIYIYLAYTCNANFPLAGGGGGLIYIDPSSIRRTTTVTTTTTSHQDNAVTMTTTASQLARAFGIVVRQIADLLTMLQDYHALAPGLPRVLDIGDHESNELQVFEVFYMVNSFFVKFLRKLYSPCHIYFAM